MNREGSRAVDSFPTPVSTMDGHRLVFCILFLGIKKDCDGATQPRAHAEIEPACRAHPTGREVTAASVYETTYMMYVRVYLIV